MNESGTKSGTKTRKILLTREAISAGLDPSITAAVENFQPLPFAAGEEAARWLREHIANPSETPWQVILMLEEGGDELLGFLVLGYTTITLSPGDVPMIAKKIEAPDQPQVALLVKTISHRMLRFVSGIPLTGTRAGVGPPKAALARGRATAARPVGSPAS